MRDPSQRALKAPVLLCCRWKSCPREKSPSSSSSSSRTGTKPGHDFVTCSTGIKVETPPPSMDLYNAVLVALVLDAKIHDATFLRKAQFLLTGLKTLKRFQIRFLDGK